jgi:anion-transporting  ArsA/GET3 family ATPase
MMVTLDDLLQRRLVLVTGKGGVGKTTLSVALASVASQRGKRVVVCEIDGPSQVAPLLGGAGGTHQPREVGDGVFLAVLSPEAGIRAYLSDRIRLPGIVDKVFKQPAVAKFFRAAPAFSEMGVLYSIGKLLEERDGSRPRWDHVIVDLPASGHAVGMLEAPFVGKRIFRAGPIRALCESVEEFLLDHELATCAVVTLPEELPVNEAMELALELRSRGLRVEAVLANAVEQGSLTQEEASVVERIRGAEPRPLLEGAAAAARRATRGAKILERLGSGLRSTPVPISYHVGKGRDLVRSIAEELETASGGDGPPLASRA